MPSVSLQMIVKDELEEVKDIVRRAHPYFDEINLTVCDHPTYDKLYDEVADDVVNIEFREWTHDFAAARNSNFEMCSTEYAFWLDADDYFVFGVIPDILDFAEKNGLDAVFLPYNYAQDERGNSVAYHWRERLVRMDAGYEWRGRVHETLISEENPSTDRFDAEVIHVTGPDHNEKSSKRNHDILVKAWNETGDPRYQMYLGSSYYARGDYRRAIETLSDFIEVTGNQDDMYRALSLISEAAYHLKRYDVAIEYATRTMTLRPDYPMGYFLLAQYEADQENWEKALEWCRVGLSKPDPRTLSVWDPTAKERAVLIAAQAEFMLGNFQNAYAWLKKVPDHETARELMNDFADEADREVFVNLLPKMRKYFKGDTALWSALRSDIAYDTRIRPLRHLAQPPKTWSNNSIVIFCGQGYEEWGPHTLDKGMGGSEEAVVYLSRELAKLGYEVTVLAEAEDWHDEVLLGGDKMNTVVWRHWKEIDTRDQFNIFVGWRNPGVLDRITAKVKVCDVHDVLNTEIVKPKEDVTYFVKSQYHRDLYPNVPDEDIRIIGNGIKKEQF